MISLESGMNDSILEKESTLQSIAWNGLVYKAHKSITEEYGDTGVYMPLRDIRSTIYSAYGRSQRLRAHPSE